MTNNEIKIVGQVHDIDLTDYFRTLTEITRMGISVNQHSLGPFVESLEPRLESMTPRQRWDVYTACITSVAAIYLGAHKNRIPRLAKFLAIHKMNDHPEHQVNAPSGSALFNLSRPGLLSAASLPVGNAIVFADLETICKALRSHATSLPELCVTPLSDELTTVDLMVLLRAINSCVITLYRK